MEFIYFVFTCMPCKSKGSFHDPDIYVIKFAGDLFFIIEERLLLCISMLYCFGVRVPFIDLTEMKCMRYGESNFSQVASDTHFISCGFGSSKKNCTGDCIKNYTVHAF